MTAQSKTVAVIGAGIVGSCTAAYLQREGCNVILIDRDEPGSQASYGNAGSVSPSAIMPVAMPGMLKKVPSWLLDPKGALRLRWWYAPVALPWLLRFLKHGRPDEVRRIAAAMRSLLADVFEAYEPLIDQANARDLIRRNGCLYVYETEEDMKAGAFSLQVRRDNGAILEPVGEYELRQMEPALGKQFRFGLYAPENGSTLDPQRLTAAIARSVVAAGGRSVRANVRSVRSLESGLEINGDGEAIRVDSVVIAAGAWSKALARQLGDDLPLETQRGYHATVPAPNVSPSRTVMWPQRNLMANPMAMGLRFAGTVELAGLQAAPDMRRARALLDLGCQLFPELRPQEPKYWMGHRPCFPDSLPVIDHARLDRRVFYAFGHQHVGMCGAATTGRAVAALVTGRQPSLDISPFSARRFGHAAGEVQA